MTPGRTVGLLLWEPKWRTGWYASVGSTIPRTRKEPDMSAESAAAAREETVKSGDRGIFVRSWQPDGTARAVVVLCHGFNSHSGYYVRTGEALVARGVGAYALDLRGRGRSIANRSDLASVTDFVQDVETV